MMKKQEIAERTTSSCTGLSHERVAPTLLMASPGGSGEYIPRSRTGSVAEDELETETDVLRELQFLHE